MKILKKLVIVLVVVVGLVAVLGVVGLLRIDALARNGIEFGATKALGTKTTLGSAKVGVFSGTFGMGDLSIANPAGFKSPTFFSLGEGNVAVSLASLRKDVVELPLLKFSTIRVSLEKAGGKTNYGVILDNVKKLAGESASKPKGKESEGKKFIVREIDIRDVKVHVDMLGTGGMADQIASLDIPIDQVKLHDVGTSGGAGVDVSTLASVIVKALLEAASAKGQGLIPAELLNDLQGHLSSLSAELAKLDGLKDVGVEMVAKFGEQGQHLSGQISRELEKALGPDAGKKLADTVGKGLEGAKDGLGKGVEDAAKKVDDKLKNLIPGTKKKDEPKKEGGTSGGGG